MSTLSLTPTSEANNGLRSTAAVLAIALALYAWLSPNHYHPWPSFHGQLGAAVAAALLAALSFSDARSVETRWPWLACGAVVLAIVPWLQYAAAMISFSGDAWMASAYLLAFALSLVVGRRLSARYGLHQVLEAASGLVVAGALLSMWVVMNQWFFLSTLGVFAMELVPPKTRALANLGQPNLVALALTLGALGTLFLYERRRIGNAVSLLLVALYALGVAMAQSRIGVLMWLVLPAWIAFAAYRHPGDFRVTPMKVGLALVCAASTFLLLPGLIEWRLALTGESDARTLEAVAASGNRVHHWAAMLDAISRAPWWGYGWNQVGAAQFLVAPDHPVTMEVLGDSHNLILDLLVHNGVPIGGTVALALAYWLWTHLRAAHSAAEVVAMAAILAFALHSMVEFPLNYLFFLLPCGLLMGAMSLQSPGQPVVQLPPWLAPTVLVALVVLGGFVVRDYFQAEAEMQSLRFEQNRVGRKLPRTLSKDVVVLTQVAAFLQFADTRLERSDLDADELELVRKVALRYPGWSVVTHYAGDLVRNGQAQQATDVLNRICYTHNTSDCNLARLRWKIWSDGDPRIASVVFPPVPPSSAP
jgi:O-antigen ligase